LTPRTPGFQAERSPGAPQDRRIELGFIEKHHGKYRGRYRDASGRLRSKSFTLKADAERFVREEEVALERGAWIDSRAAEMSLAEWCERFMSLARRLAGTTQQTYRRDLDRYVLPKFGSYRLGRMRAEEIEEWLLDEIDSGLAPSSVHRHYRTLHACWRWRSRTSASLSTRARACSHRPCRGGAWSSSTGRRASTWPMVCRRDTGRLCSWRSTPGCAGASWSASAGRGST
jgi:hypothetical protein